MSNLFRRGYAPAREEKERQEKARENYGAQLYQFFLSADDDEAQVRFLTEEPINFYAHVIKNGNHYDTKVCTQDDDCPYCDDDRASYKGAYLIYDKRGFEAKDKKGKKKKVKGQIRLYVQGMRAIGQLDRLSNRYGLTKCDYLIARSGTGQSTTYTFERLPEEADKLTKKEIENLLPEKLREIYDGTQESLYLIVEKQIEMMMDNAPEEDDEEDIDDEEVIEEKARRSKLVNIDDDEDTEEDDEEEDDEPPVKKAKPLAKKILGKKILGKKRQ